MDVFLDVMRYTLFSIPVYLYLVSFAAILAGFVLRRVLAWLHPKLLRIADRSHLVFDGLLIDAAVKPTQWFAVLGGVWVGLTLLPLPSEYVDFERFFQAFFKGFSIGLLVWFGLRLIDNLTGFWAKKAELTETKLDDMLVPIVRSASKVFIVVVGLILVLQNLGYSVTSLVAGLGIGGAAIALASKETLSNLFGSLVIFFDKPFQIDDWIEVGSVEGTVEEIGLRVTRVRTFANSQITIPNAQFTTSAVNNWSRMRKRRLKMSFGVAYGTSSEQLTAIVDGVRELIANDDDFHHDFFLVNFDSIGTHSLEIFVYAFVKSTVWKEFLESKQRFLLGVMRVVEQHGATFAMPRQAVHIESMPGEPAAMRGERPL